MSVQTSLLRPVLLSSDPKIGCLFMPLPEVFTVLYPNTEDDNKLLQKPPWKYDNWHLNSSALSRLLMVDSSALQVQSPIGSSSVVSPNPIWTQPVPSLLNTPQRRQRGPQASLLAEVQEVSIPFSTPQCRHSGSLTSVPADTSPNSHDGLQCPNTPTGEN